MLTKLRVVYGPYKHGNRWRTRIENAVLSFATKAEAQAYIDGSRHSLADLTAVLGGMVDAPRGTTWVYVLYSCGRVIYVGKTQNVAVRIKVHRAGGIPFDRAVCIRKPISGKAALQLERWLIWKLQPPLNIRRPGTHSKNTRTKAEETINQEGNEAAKAA